MVDGAASFVLRVNLSNSLVLNRLGERITIDHDQRLVGPIKNAAIKLRAFRYVMLRERRVEDT